MKKFLIISCVILAFPFWVACAQEQAEVAVSSSTSAEQIAPASSSPIVLSGKLEVTPTIIDEKAKARDILKYNIILKNGTERMVSVYAMVNDISASDGQQEFVEPSMLDRKTSLASWITFSRGVKDIPAGQEVSIPLEINVDLTAIPGKRFAQISFPSGSSRNEAQASANSGETPKVIINISVEEEVVEKAQIKNFSTAKNAYINFPVDFKVELENFGNRQINPQGAIIIYNRRGEEVASLDLNASGERIEPGTNKAIAGAWTDGRGFGKFKAKLEIEYGEKDKRDLQDTIYFWLLPLPFLLMFFAATLVLITVVTVFLFKKTYRHLPHLPELHHQAKSIENNGVINLKKE